MNWIILLATLQSFAAWAACEDLTGCKVLQCELEQEILLAKKQGHKERAAEAQATLDRSRRNCTDAQKSFRDQKSQESMVDARIQELRDAEDAENPVKEEKKKMRLDEEMKELERMRNP